MSWNKKCISSTQFTIYVFYVHYTTRKVLTYIITPSPIHRGDGVLFSIDFFVYIFVSLLARLRENSWTDLHEIFREGVEWPWHDLVTLLANSEKPRDAAMRNTGTGFVVLLRHSLLQFFGRAYCCIPFMICKTVWHLSVYRHFEININGSIVLILDLQSVCNFFTSLRTSKCRGSTSASP